MAVASLITLLYTATYIGTAFALPAYATFKAIEHDGPDAFRVREWSMYWTVLAAFICLQYFVDFALCWLPFYYVLKLGFLASLWLPSTRLAIAIYRSALGPLLSSHEADIDATWHDTKARVVDSQSRQQAIVKDSLQRIAGKASVMLQQAQNKALEQSRTVGAGHGLAGKHAPAGQHAPAAPAQPQGIRHRNLNVGIAGATGMNAASEQAPSMLAPGVPREPTTPTPSRGGPVDHVLHAE